MPQGTPVQGEFYRHFKDKMYQIVAVATHSETREQLVIYQALYDDFRVYARPYDMFISEVDHVKYPDVKDKYRFTLVDNQANSKEDDIPEKKINHVSDGTKVLDVSDYMLAFLDAELMEEKYNILIAMKDEVTDTMLDNLAASLDVVLSDGSIDKRFEELKTCIRTRQRFETNRFNR